MTMEIMEINPDPKGKTDLVHIRTSQFFWIGIITVSLIVGVGLLCFYIPSRPCTEPFKIEPEPTPPTTVTLCPTDEPAPQITVEPETTTTMTTTQATTPWPGRLPTDVLPHSYDLYLKPYINDEDLVGTDKERFTFDGRVTIRVNCHRTTDRITLHYHDIDIVKINVFTEDGRDIYEHMWEQEIYQFLYLEMKEFLKVGETYDVIIEYVGKLNDGLSGFYRSSYTNAAGEVV